MSGIRRGLKRPKVLEDLGERLWKSKLQGGVYLLHLSPLGNKGGHRVRDTEFGPSCGSRVPIAGPGFGAGE